MATEQLVKAIYLTLLHSLWQGAAIAGLAGLVILVSKRSSAASRYNFLAASMGLFVLCAIVTFFKFLSIPSDTVLPGSSATIALSHSPNEVFVTPVEQLFSVASTYSSRIVLLWFLIICLKSLQFYLGFQRVSNLKTKQTSNPGAKWIRLADSLSQNLGIRARVALLESTLTSIPLTVGYFKPMILVPLGMLTAIPADQVEAILLHELAHIKRKDYFINIFQSIIELLFFFNPAIWWLSSLIRAERENCCDDIAIANSGSKINYVRALISFEEYRAQHPQIAIALTGSENTLLKRTRRIIDNQNNTLNSMEKFILTSGLVLSGLLSFAFTDNGKEQISNTVKPVVAMIDKTIPPAHRFFVDTLPASSIREISMVKGGLTTFNTVHKGKAYKIVMKDDEVTELFVDNTKIATDRIGDHTEAMVEIFEFSDAVKMAAREQQEHAEEFKLAAIDQTENLQALSALSASLESMNALKDLSKENSRVRGLALSLKKEISSLKGLARLAELNTMSDTIIPPRPPKAPSTPSAPKAPATPALPLAPAAPAAPETKNEKMKATPAPRAKGKTFKASPAINVQPTVSPAVEVYITPVVKPAIKIAPGVEPAIEVKPNEFAQNLNEELIKEGLVKDVSRFSYKINNSELIVDGVKQSVDQHKRIIVKVLKRPNDKIEYTYTRQ